MKAKLLDKNGSLTGEIDLPPKPFEIKPNLSVIWQYVKTYLANQRQGNHKAKPRNEVSGGGKKPWRQKGTGRARVGSSRNPLWRHGGVTFPPIPRSHRLEMPKKMKRLALASILSDRAKENVIYVIDAFDFAKPQTKAMLSILSNAKINIERPTLIITQNCSENVYKSARNIEKIKITHIGELNPYQVITAVNIIFEKKALNIIEERYNNEVARPAQNNN
jgi:large subunit ribosomal protein L4